MDRGKIRNAIKSAIFYSYLKLFGREPGALAMNFIKNLGFIFCGLTIAKFLSAFFQIYVGRTLGPLEYGKFALVAAISQFFYMPMLLGVSTALTKYLAEYRTDAEREKILSTGIALIILTTSAFSLIFYIASAQIASLASVSRSYVIVAIFLAIFYGAWVVAQKIFQGLYRMKKLSIANVIWGLLIASSVFLLSLHLKNARAPLLALIIGHIVSSTLVIPEIKKYFHPKLDLAWAKALLNYGIFAMLGGVSFIITENIIKLFLNIFLSIEEVGIYQAYYFSTLGVTGFFAGGFITVFFPKAASYEDKSSLFNQLNKLMRITPLLYMIVVFISAIILSLYGKEFFLAIPLIFLFALASVISFVYSLYNWFTASIGIKGVRINLITSIFIAALSTSIAYVFIPQNGIYGAVFALIVPYFAGAILLYYMVRRLIKEEKR